LITSFMPLTARATTGVGCDLAQVHGVVRAVELDALVQVARQQAAHLVRIGGRQQARAQVFGADGVGLFLLVGLARVVAADGHREAEADDQAEQRERGGLDDGEVFARARVHRAPLRDRHARARRDGQRDQRQHEHLDRMIDHHPHASPVKVM
jgi:hypothetical protein